MDSQTSKREFSEGQEVERASKLPSKRERVCEVESVKERENHASSGHVLLTFTSLKTINLSLSVCFPVRGVLATLPWNQAASEQ